MAQIFALFLGILSVFHSLPASNGMYSRVNTAYWVNLREEARERQEVLQIEEDNARDVFKAAHQTIKHEQSADSVAVCRYAIAGMQWQQFQQYNEQINFQGMLEDQQKKMFRKVYDKIQSLKKGENGTEQVLNPEAPLDFKQCLAAYKEFRQQYFADTAVVTYEKAEKPAEMEKEGDRIYGIFEIVEKKEPESQIWLETIRDEESKARVVFKHEHHNLALVPHDELEVCRCAVAAMQWQIFNNLKTEFIDFTGPKEFERAQKHIQNIKQDKIGTDSVLHPKHPADGTFEECLGVYQKLRSFYHYKNYDANVRKDKPDKELADMKKEGERIFGILGIVESKMERIIHAGEVKEHHKKNAENEEEQQKQVENAQEQHHDHAGDEHQQHAGGHGHQHQAKEKHEQHEVGQGH